MFVKRLGVDDQWASCESRPEREPDLLCYHRVDGFVAWELVAVTDPRIAELCSLGDRASRNALWTTDPTEKIIRKKLGRKYNTTHPIELLVYSDGLLISTDDMIVPTIKMLSKSIQSPFRKIWFMGEDIVECVWSKE